MLIIDVDADATTFHELGIALEGVALLGPHSSISTTHLNVVIGHGGKPNIDLFNLVLTRKMLKNVGRERNYWFTAKQKQSNYFSAFSTQFYIRTDATS